MDSQKILMQTTEKGSSASLQASVDLLANRPSFAACAAYVPNTPPRSLAHALHLNPFERFGYGENNG